MIVFIAVTRTEIAVFADHADGVTPNELVPLNLGSTRTTALLNCLLQLKRVRLTVRNGQQLCQLLAAE